MYLSREEKNRRNARREVSFIQKRRYFAFRILREFRNVQDDVDVARISQVAGHKLGIAPRWISRCIVHRELLKTSRPSDAMPTDFSGGLCKRSIWTSRKVKTNFGGRHYSPYSLPLSLGPSSWSACGTPAFSLLFFVEHHCDQGKWGLRFRIKAYSDLMAITFEISSRFIGPGGLKHTRTRQNEIPREFFTYLQSNPRFD